MKKLLGVTLLALILLALGGVEGRGAGDCAGPAVAPPAPAPANVCASAGVTYVEQVMTGYRAEVRTRAVTRTVSRVVTREVEEAYQYTEMVPVTVAEKQTRTEYRTV